MTRRREAGDFVDLFGALKRRLMAVATQAYAAAGMGRIQGKLLRHVGERSPISQAELARATDTDAALTGRTVQGLIADGLVRRQRSEEDRREYVLELTAAGRRAKERVERARAELGARLGAVLDERDREDFERVVRKILAAFDATSADARR
jgi:DNA-binding MarR family transcriptional regulator